MPGRACRAFSYLLVNENNIRVLVRELVNYLLVADTEFKQDLTAKICIVVQKFAPSKQWHVDTIIKVCDACARARCSPSMTVRAGRSAATVPSMRSATCVYCRRPKHTARHGTPRHGIQVLIVAGDYVTEDAIAHLIAIVSQVRCTGHSGGVLMLRMRDYSRVLAVGSVGTHGSAPQRTLSLTVLLGSPWPSLWTRSRRHCRRPTFTCTQCTRCTVRCARTVTR